VATPFFTTERPQHRIPATEEVSPRRRALGRVRQRRKGNKPLETRLKIWARSNGRIKSCASWNSSKNLSTIQRSDQELWTSWASTLVRPEETRPPSHGDFIAMPRKQASWNSCKYLSTIQRSDQELRPSWAGTLVWFLVWSDKMLWVSSSNFSATLRKKASRTHLKIWARSKGRINSYGPLEPAL